MVVYCNDAPAIFLGSAQTTYNGQVYDYASFGCAGSLFKKVSIDKSLLNTLVPYNFYSLGIDLDQKLDGSIRFKVVEAVPVSSSLIKDGYYISLDNNKDSNKSK